MGGVSTRLATNAASASGCTRIALPIRTCGSSPELHNLYAVARLTERRCIVGMSLADRQAVELFHLQFVRLLCAGPDKDRFAIKGGCNLRFFFESMRYSEDIVLDVTRIPVHTLKEKVAKLLAGPALALPLESRGLAIAEVSAPKQTETTQRWKVALSSEGHALPLHTKIEFSRRETADQPRIESIAPAVLAEYGLMPVLAPHYPLAAAMRQKIGTDRTDRGASAGRVRSAGAHRQGRRKQRAARCGSEARESDRARHGGLLRRLQGPGDFLPEARAHRGIRLEGSVGRHPVAGCRLSGERPAMNAAEALGRLKGLHVPAVTTADAAAVLGLTGTAASQMLRRLSKAGLVTAFRKGVWAVVERPDALAMAECATAPYPAYVSLQTALFQRGLIEQIPSMIYLVSLARTARVETSAGTYMSSQFSSADSRCCRTQGSSWPFPRRR